MRLCAGGDILKAKDFIFGVLAGFVFIALWYGQMFAGWLQADTEFLTGVYPLIPAVLLALLLISSRVRRMLMKTAICILSAFVFFMLGSFANVPYRLLNIALPDYGRLSAGGGFAIMIFTMFYLSYIGIAWIVALCVSIVLSFACRKEKKPNDETQPDEMQP